MIKIRAKSILSTQFIIETQEEKFFCENTEELLDKIEDLITKSYGKIKQKTKTQYISSKMINKILYNDFAEEKCTTNDITLAKQIYPGEITIEFLEDKVILKLHDIDFIGYIDLSSEKYQIREMYLLTFEWQMKPECVISTLIEQLKYLII